MKKIVYIPLDDRPVCYKRVKLLAESCGLEITIPKLEMCRTILDNRPKNAYSLTHGSTSDIFNWFKNLNHDEIDYYIISIDQIISGGLVNSRSDYNNDLNKSYQLFDEYLKIIGNKKTILIDSLSRLAVTCCYDGNDLIIYEGTRKYAMVEREKKDDLKSIFSSYEYDLQGNYIDYKKYNLTDEIKEKYLKNRKRKALLNDYIIKKVKEKNALDGNIFYMLGIDDSYPYPTIQTNEITYFNKIIDPKWGLVFIGIDELPLMGLANVVRDIYNIPSAKCKCHFIGEKQFSFGDVYDTGSIDECLNKHMQILSVERVDKDEDLHVVMLTYNQETYEKNVQETINLVNSLLNENKFVILMDLVGYGKNGRLEEEMVKKIPLSKILSFSCWNTTANRIGISLSIGLARFYYLKKFSISSLKASVSYLKLLTICYVKDICYKTFATSKIGKYINDKSRDKYACLNFYTHLSSLTELNKITEEYMDKLISVSSKDVLNNINNNDYIGGYDNNKSIYLKHSNVSVNKYCYPWYRTFELDFSVEVEKMRIVITIDKEKVDSSMFDNVEVYNGIIEDEIKNDTVLECFLGAWYHKSVSSKDYWLGIETVVTLGEFTPDEKRFNLDGTNRYMDNHNLYLGGMAETESDCGLGYNTMYDSSDTSEELTTSSPKYGYRPFYRFICNERIADGGNVDVINANYWRTSNPRDLGNYYFPGDKVRMKVYSPLPNYLQLRIDVIEETKIPKYVALRKKYNLPNDQPTSYISPLFYSLGHGVIKAEFKHVNSIDQYGNEGLIAKHTSSTVKNEIWHECYLYRMYKGKIVKVPFNKERQSTINSPSNEAVKVSIIDDKIGAEKIEISPEGCNNQCN